ncbi:hypothetical protein KP509_10G026100 [Ceratopteris richardii]|uniref:Kinesin-like protein n=1 Tax=Ceratopteris richardii TaxID=49495 RepID=A0A8T2TZM8_CERRI|nr:hypothetical protein KP509_10G026100 [Ceratopteris richardii]
MANSRFPAAADRGVLQKCLSNSASSPFGRLKRSASSKEEASVPGRVRVAVRLRPRNAEELKADLDFADCVELEPELHRLKLRKNNWDYETFQFDEVLTEHASQKRVYEVVGKPVVESVLQGYNGTIMAYGQTGTGKTYTLGRLDEEDDSNRGIMIRAVEDLLSGISLKDDCVTVSYLQLYMETVQDLLAPEKENIPIVDDPKMRDVLIPGASVVEIRDHKSFSELLKSGEANRAVANTKLNAESSRSHAILVINVRRLVSEAQEKSSPSDQGFLVPTIRRSKLVIVDLAGSERIDKSGVGGSSLDEAKSINLSLTALGKCINAIAEGNSHVPIRDSKLTRLLRDSFGGTARTSLVITIGPSPLHRGETSSTIMFGQRAMKVENMVRLKEEFDYKSLCRRLEREIDKLLVENERHTKAMIGAEDLQRTYEEMAANQNVKHQKELKELSSRLHAVNVDREKLQLQLRDSQIEVQLEKELGEEINRRLELEAENKDLNDKVLQLQNEVNEMQRELEQMRSGYQCKADKSHPVQKMTQNSNGQNRSKSTIVKLFEQVGLQNLLALLKSPDEDVQLQALRVIANLAADEAHQVKIMEGGGLSLLLDILRKPKNDSVCGIVAGAIANLAMRELNQVRLVEEGVIELLVIIAHKAQDPQTLRMVAGALANLCGNGEIQEKLRSEGGIKVLLKMGESQYLDVQAQVARALANIAKCESKRALQEYDARSLLIEEEALPWIVEKAKDCAEVVHRHIEMALVHLAQNECNAEVLVNSGAFTELVRISHECMKEDVRSLAYRVVCASPVLQAEFLRFSSTSPGE